MTDRELLEAAARAVGIKLLFDPHGMPRDCTGMDPAMNIFAAPIWIPLTEDGDAFRLGVKLEIDLCFCANYVIADGEQVPTVNNSNDRCLATRYAIVRAAAAMAGEGK